LHVRINYIEFMFYLVLKYSDGSTQQLAGCLRDFRNKPFATRARIEYYMNSLTVSMLENFLVTHLDILFD